VGTTNDSNKGFAWVASAFIPLEPAVMTNEQERDIRDVHPSKTAMDEAAAPVALQSWASPPTRNKLNGVRVTKNAECLTLPDGNGLRQSVCEPELDKRLSRYAQAAGFPVQRVHHPSGEIDVYSLGNSANAPRLAEIELVYDVLTRVKLAVQCLRFHKSSPLRVATA
jgi:hypothetical protein